MQMTARKSEMRYENLYKVLQVLTRTMYALEQSQFILNRSKFVY